MAQNIGGITIKYEEFTRKWVLANQEPKALIFRYHGYAMECEIRHNPHLREVRRSRSVNQSSTQPSTKSTMPYRQMSSKSMCSNPTDHFITPSESSRYRNTPYFDIPKSRINTSASLGRKNTSAMPTDYLISPPVSSRYSALPPFEKSKPSSVMKPSSKTRPNNQVVVLRVSLNCKGCEGKVRKHIS